MKIDPVRRVAREDLADAPKGEWLDTMLTTQNQQSESVIQALRGNLNVADNMTDWFFEGGFKHGVEQRIRVPKGKPSPVGVSSVMVKNPTSVGAATAVPVVQSVSMRYLNGTSGTEPEQVGITVYYAMSANDYVESFATNVPAVTTNIPFNVTSISVPPGSWRVTGIVGFEASGATVQNSIMAVNTVSANVGTFGNNNFYASPPTAALSFSGTVPNWYVSVSVTTTIYLVARYAFSAGIPIASGRLVAIRTAIDPATTANVTLRFHGG